jgi:hypothetical protein
VRTYEAILCDPEEHGARKAIKCLTTKHDIAELDLRLRIAMFPIYQYFGTGRRWSERFNIDRDSAKRLAQRLREDAEELRKALTPQFKFVIGGPLSADSICDIISRSAVLIEGSLKETTDRRADWTLEPKRELTQFVWRTTGRPLDAEMADITAAILGLERYTFEDQRKFRERNCTLNGTDSIVPAAPKPDKIPPIKG